MWFHAIYKEGNELNKAIDDNKPKEVVEALKKCCDAIIEVAVGEPNLKAKMRRFKKRCDKMVEDYGDYLEDDVLNHKLLDRFYDICDSERIWIDAFGGTRENR